jgi:hypothetical protein
MFTRKNKPVEDRVQRVVEATGRTPESRRDAEPPGDLFRAAAPGPIPPRRIVEPEPEPLYPPPGRNAAPIDQVSSLRQNVMQRVEREPDKEEPALVARLRRNWLHDRPDPLVLGAVVVVATVVGLVMLPLLFRGGSKKSSTAQNPTVVAAQPTSAAASATSAAGVKPSATPVTASVPIFSAQTPVVTPAAARPAASSPALAAQPTSAARPASASQGSGLGPSAGTIASATPAPGSTPPVTRPARSAPLAPPEPSATPDAGQSLANVVGNAAASQPPPIAQVGTSAPGQVTIPGVTSSASSGSRTGVAPARSGVSSGGGSAPVAAAAPVQPTTIAPSLDTLAAQTSRAAGAAASRGGH